MSRALGTICLWSAGLIAALFGLTLLAAASGFVLATWMIGAFLINGQVLLIFFLLSLLVGLELRLLSGDVTGPGGRRHATRVGAVICVLLGLAGAVFSRWGLVSFSAYSMTNLLILALAGIWFGIYLFRRSRI